METLLITLYVVGFLANIFVKTSYDRYFFQPSDSTEDTLSLLNKLCKKANACSGCTGSWIIDKNTIMERYKYGKLCSSHYNELEIIKNTKTSLEYEFEWDEDIIMSCILWPIFFPVFIVEKGGQIYAEHLLKEKEIRQLELAQNAKYLAEGYAEVEAALAPNKLPKGVINA